MQGMTESIHRSTALYLYAALVFAVLVMGKSVIHWTMDTRFYSHYLSLWETAITEAEEKALHFPEFTGNNHAQYMDALTLELKKNAIFFPNSNTTRPYVYQISKIGADVRELFLLCLKKQIVIYGLPKGTFNRLDKHIDGKVNPMNGRFKGKLQKDNESYAGILRL